MKKLTQIPNEESFYRLPFEKGTFTLTEETLNKHSTHRKPEYSFQIQVRNLNFRNEILTIGVKLEKEAEQKVYIKVRPGELLVSCSFDTDFSYLSRYAYFGLFSLIGYRSSLCFKEFYWPDFFDPQNGRSKFLKIYNDRRGMDIEIKSNYPHFYRPGDQLMEWFDEVKTRESIPLNSIFQDELPLNDTILGYFLADTNMSSFHSNHFPFLVPFLGKLTTDKERIKGYIKFIQLESDLHPLLNTTTSKQDELNEICFKMRELAHLRPTRFWDPLKLNEDEIARGKQLFELWHEAIGILHTQKFTLYYFTRGLKILKEKPSRSWVRDYEFRKEFPQLLVKKIDKGDYFLLELCFKVNDKTYTPEYPNTAFFINAKVDYKKIYLLRYFTDYQVVCFFAEHKYKFAILKCHYKDEILEFVNLLAERYEVKGS